MIILAMECATPTVSLAFLDGGKTLAELFLDTGRGHSEILLPALESLMGMAGVTMEGVDLFAATTGPGSFTAVRIGVTTIKGLAMATGRPIVAVSTLEALAMNGFPSSRLICPLLDARRGQVYTGLYRMGPEGLPEAVAPDRLTDIGSLVESLASEDLDFIGETSLLDREGIPAGAVQGSFLQTCLRNRPSATAVGRIALHRHQQGNISDPLTFSPCYLRPTGIA